MVSKEKTDTEIKYDLFQKGYAEANPLISRQDQVRNAKKLWTEVKNDPEKYEDMMRSFKLKTSEFKTIVTMGQFCKTSQTSCCNSSKGKDIITNSINFKWS